MTSNYDNIFKSFLGLITEYDFLNIDEQYIYENMGEWIEGVYCRPKVRKLFSSIKLDNEVMELTYTLRNSIDEDYDKHFVENLMANGMVIGWLSPKVKSSQLVNQFFGTKEQKYYSQANHLDAIKSLLKKCESILDKDFVRDHTYSYFALNGDVN